MLITQLQKDVRDIRRLEHILGILAKYGFGYIVDKLHLPVFVAKPAKKEDFYHLPIEVRARRILEELGPTFIKLGQMLSLHPEVIPYSFCKEFEKLQDRVAPIDYETIKMVVESEFHKPIARVFKAFAHESLASASLAQVHEVRFRKKDLIVKIQKPHVEGVIKTDIEILEFLVSLIEKHFEEALQYNPRGILEEFKIYILGELNFSHEIVHLEKFRRNFRGSKSVYFPRTYRRLSTPKILVMEKISGVKISDLNKGKAGRLHKLDKKKTALILADCVLKQIFTDGFFHADPHPGNIFVLKNGRICFLDFGLVGRLDEAKKFRLVDIMTACIDKDVDRIIDLFRELGALESSNEEKLKISLEEILDRYYGISLEEFDMNTFFKDLVKVISENKVKILPDYFLLLKTLVTAEGVGKMLDPHFNLTEKAQEFTRELIKEKYSAARVAKRFRKFGNNTIDFLQAFPRDIYTVLNKVKRGELKVGFVHTNLEKLIAMMDKVSSRLSFSVILAALIVGSSIVINTTSTTFFGRSHHLGVVGFIIAAVLGVWLLINILRSGRF
ncbi:MAG: AarF/UbiB family protein [Candidatus Omnitrophota bacterium]